MKKFMFVLVVIAALAALAVTVASADPPSGVTAAVIIKGDECYFTIGTIAGDSEYVGTGKLVYSNSKTGEFIYQCKGDLDSGPAIDINDNWQQDNCRYHILAKGSWGKITQHCFDMWSP